MYYNTLIKEFKERKFKNVYLLYGKERYIIDKLIEFLKEKIIESTYLDFNLKEINYKNSNVSKILENLETLPFMSDYTFTIVHNASLMIKEINDYELDMLSEYLKKPNSTSVVIFIGGKIDKRKKVYKKLKKYSEVVEFDTLSSNEFSKWVNKYISNCDKIIRNNELAYLIKETGYLLKDSTKTLYKITQDLEKIVNYSNEKEITIEIIDKFIDKPIENNIFLLIDSLFNNQGEKALDILDLMNNKGEPLIVVLFMIIKQFRVILKMKILIETGITSKDASKIIGVHPFVGQKAASKSKKISYKTLKIILDKSIEIDRKSKTISVAIKLLIEEFIAEITYIINK